jgi:hypothetical protein
MLRRRACVRARSSVRAFQGPQRQGGGRYGRGRGGSVLGAAVCAIGTRSPSGDRDGSHRGIGGAAGYQIECQARVSPLALDGLTSSRCHRHVVSPSQTPVGPPGDVDAHDTLQCACPCHSRPDVGLLLGRQPASRRPRRFAFAGHGLQHIVGPERHDRRERALHLCAGRSGDLPAGGSGAADGTGVVNVSPDGRFLMVANAGELPTGFNPAFSADPEGTSHAQGLPRPVRHLHARRHRRFHPRRQDLAAHGQRGRRQRRLHRSWRNRAHR